MKCVMSRRSLVLLVLNMIDCVEKLESVTLGLTYDDFCKDVKAFYAAMALVSILGEAANQITKIWENLPDTIPWDKLRTIRNRVVHAYFYIDSQILWVIASVEVPQLKIPLQELLEIYDRGTGFLVRDRCESSESQEFFHWNGAIA